MNKIINCLLHTTNEHLHKATILQKLWILEMIITKLYTGIFKLQVYLSFSIFDYVPFIQDTIVPADGAEEVDVIPHNIIGRHNQIVLLHLLLNSTMNQPLHSTFTSI